MPTKMGHMPMAIAGKSKSSPPKATRSAPYSVKKSGPSMKNTPTSIGGGYSRGGKK